VVEDLALADRMVYGVIVTASDPAAARAAALRAVAMIDPALARSDDREGRQVRQREESS
jgi:hypothetical protein